MPTITKIDETGAVLGEHELSDRLVEEKADIGLLHEVVRSELAASRRGTAAGKNRSRVAGSGAKPWRQKGTGRARAGSVRVSQWTGGGMAFPPIPRDWSFKINKKARAKAFRMALGNLVQGGGVRVLATEEFEEPSTKRAAEIMGKAELEGPTLVVAGPDEINLLLSFRNLPNTRVLPLTVVEVQDYLWARTAVITQGAVALLEGGES
jgi:large subunit ribosomal protein L4